MTTLARSAEPLAPSGGIDPLTAEIMQRFDIAAESVPERVRFYPWVVDGVLPTDWGLGCVVGASGTGKSTLLRDLGRVARPRWKPGIPIAGHFDSAEEAVDRLGAVGLNSIPVWARPYAVLSTGEKFRADLARVVGDGALVDEYTSTVSRVVAQSASRSLRKWIVRRGVRRMVIASCHYDVLPWLQPDWVISTDDGSFTQAQTSTRNAEHWWMEWAEPEPSGKIAWS